jgi:molybdopterin-guanine dinucleotide biosynthesis protein A
VTDSTTARRLPVNKSAIVLAGGSSTRLGQDKGLLKLAGKPLIAHVLDAVSNLVDEKIIVVSTQTQAQSYARTVGTETEVVVDKAKTQTPLQGALSGFEKAHGTYSILLPCDTPLVSRAILSLLLELCANKAATIPRWPNGCIEPLQAVYQTKPALDSATSVISDGCLNMRDMTNRLMGVRYISTLVLQQLDLKLETFLNINTPYDLKKAEEALRIRGKKAIGLT